MEKTAKRLTYRKVNNSDNVIEISLHNGYTVRAVSGWDPQKACFITSFELRGDTVANYELIEEADGMEFHENHRTINPAILKAVSEFLDDGFFDYYIKRYAFHTSCVDAFYELCEKESQLDIF